MPRRLLAYAEPDDITGLVCWLKADSLTASDGDLIASWTDESGNSNTPVQATAGAKPTYKVSQVNGLPVLRFDGGDRMAFPDETQFDLATPSIFVIAKRTSGNCIMSKNTTGTGGAGRRKMQITMGGYSSGSDAQSIGVTAATGVFNMFGVVARGDSDHTLLINGVESNFTTALGDSTLNNAAMELGASFSNGAEAFTGDIAEVIIYNKPLSSLERIGLQNYLYGKYNISIPSSLGGTPRTAVSGRTHIPSVPGVRLDGVDDYVNIGSLGDLGSFFNNDGLVSFAFRMRTDILTEKSIMGTINSATGTAFLIKMNRNSSGTTTENKMGIFIRNSSNVFQNVGTTNTIGLADGNMHHYVVQRASRYVWEIWQDGIQMTMTNPSASGDLTANFSNFSHDFGIGADANASGVWEAFAAMDICDVMIYKRKLTSSEIPDLAAGTIPSGSFRHFYLNQPGDIAIDSSSNAVNGIIVGGSVVSTRRLVGSSYAA